MAPILKFAHMLFVLGLFSLTIYCFALIGSKKTTMQHKFNRLSITIIVLSMLAIITGTLLVYPKHFTFHTHWIQAAYLFTLIFTLSILATLPLKKERMQRWIWRLGYLALMIILIAIIHDAVTKSTFY